MNDVNPFAATRTPKVISALDQSWEQLWRDSENQRDLVMHKDARLPNRCVKSGVEVTEPGIERKFLWHNPWIETAISFNPIIFLMLAAVCSKKATIVVPLCEEERVKRKNRITGWWTVALSSVALLLVCVTLVINCKPGTENMYLLGAILGFIGISTGLLAGQSTARILRPVRITDTKVWLRGVHPSIVDNLPLLPNDMLK